jgi:hypothetical protein
MVDGIDVTLRYQDSFGSKSRLSFKYNIAHPSTNNLVSPLWNPVLDISLHDQRAGAGVFIILHRRCACSITASRDLRSRVDRRRVYRSDSVLVDDDREKEKPQNPRRLSSCFLF